LEFIVDGLYAETDSQTGEAKLKTAIARTQKEQQSKQKYHKNVGQSSN
jgi:hypothetical protein